VTGHVGGVHGPAGPDAQSIGNHLVLTVSDLPSDENPSGVWYVDAGLGDALHEPLPLAAGEYVQEPFRLSLEARAPDRDEWHLTHDPAGGFAGMTWTDREADWTDFTEKHHWLSTSPESGFVQVAMAERRDATGVDVVRGLIFTRIGRGARTDEPLTKREDWFGLLQDVFGLRLDTSTPEARDRLWRNVLEAHRQWRPEGAG
jgi:N-hydroxyarylamine O-acetyltransferase